MGKILPPEGPLPAGALYPVQGAVFCACNGYMDCRAVLRCQGAFCTNCGEIILHILYLHIAFYRLTYTRKSAIIDILLLDIE